jgi:hypothetical protein
MVVACIKDGFKASRNQGRAASLMDDIWKSKSRLQFRCVTVRLNLLGEPYTKKKENKRKTREKKRKIWLLKESNRMFKNVL